MLGALPRAVQAVVAVVAFGRPYQSPFAPR
jgi:hypothetical protein